MHKVFRLANYKYLNITVVLRKIRILTSYIIICVHCTVQFEININGTMCVMVSAAIYQSQTCFQMMIMQLTWYIKHSFV